MTTTTDPAMDARARRAAKSVDLKAIKSRGNLHVNNQGEFRIIDPNRNLIIFGERHDLSAEDVIEFCGTRKKQ